MHIHNLTTKIVFTKSHFEQSLQCYFKRQYLSLHSGGFKERDLEERIYIHNLALLDIVIYSPLGKGVGVNLLTG